MAASPPPKSAPAAATEARPTPEALGWQLRAALPPLRLHSVSLYDAEGNVLWLSEGALGPDEHMLLMEALEKLGANPALESHESVVGDGRAALFLPVRTAAGAVCGIAMILTEHRSGSERLGERSLSPGLKELLAKLVAVMPPPPDTAASGAAPPATPQALAPRAVDALLAGNTPERTAAAPRKPAPPGTGTVAGSAGRAQPPAAVLCVQALLKLNAGSSRRFEILPRPLRPGEVGEPGAFDARATGELIAWLSRHRNAWSTEPTCFALRLSIDAIQNERFLANVGALLKAQSVPPEALAFELAESLCIAHSAAVTRFAAQCAGIGCSLVIDGFSFARAALPLLRSPSLRLIKLDTAFTATALQEKASQAMVAAAVQACKVLGIHSAAIRVDSQALLQAITALGCDFAQVISRSGPQPLDSFLRPARGTPPGQARAPG